MILDAHRRAEAKRASRARDMARLEAGHVDREALGRENGILSRDDLRGVTMVRSGKRSLGRPRRLLD
jgi:hypothetical protein